MSASFLAAVSARAADGPREHGAAAESSASLLLATNASLPKVDDIIPQLEVAAPVDISTLPPLDVMAAKLGAARDSAERMDTLETLHNYPPEMLTAAVVDALLPCLSDGCVDVTHSAVGLLCPLGSTALAPHAPAILAHFEAAQDGVRWRVAEVLAALEPEALADQCGASVAALLAADSDDVRRRAVELLGSFPPAARAQHAPSALALLEDEDEDARLSAVEFFGKLDAATLDALPGLRDALVGRLDPSLEQEGCVRMTVVTVLAGLPHEPLLALVPRLVACLDDDFWRVRRAAMEALTNVPASALATESHLHAVLARLTHSDARVREWAVATLGKLIPAMPAGDAVSAVAARSTEALRPLLEDEDRRCRERAGALTQAIAKLAAAALPSQSEGGNDNDDDELPPLE